MEKTSTKRDRTARFRIRRFLASHGAVEDTSGYATSILKEAVDYQGSSVAFIQLVAAMERDGEIVREIRGKRTYRIALAMADMTADRLPRYDVQYVANGSPDALALDYERLAHALVAEMTQSSSGRDSQLSTEQSLAMERLRSERDEFAARLDLAERQIRLLLGEELSVRRNGALTNASV